MVVRTQVIVHFRLRVVLIMRVKVPNRFDAATASPTGVASTDLSTAPARRLVARAVDGRTILVTHERRWNLASFGRNLHEKAQCEDQAVHIQISVVAESLQRVKVIDMLRQSSGPAGIPPESCSIGLSRKSVIGSPNRADHIWSLCSPRFRASRIKTEPRFCKSPWLSPRSKRLPCELSMVEARCRWRFAIRMIEM